MLHCEQKISDKSQTGRKTRTQSHGSTVVGTQP